MLFACLQPFLARGLKHAFEAPQQCERQDDFAELRMSEITPKILAFFQMKFARVVESPLPFPAIHFSNLVMQTTIHDTTRLDDDNLQPRRSTVAGDAGLDLRSQAALRAQPVSVAIQTKWRKILPQRSRGRSFGSWGPRVILLAEVN